MYYKYKVTWYNSYKDEEQKDEGMVFAKDYSVAADRVVNDYGKDAVINIYLYEIYNEGDGFCISKYEIDSAFQTKDA